MSSQFKVKWKVSHHPEGLSKEDKQDGEGICNSFIGVGIYNTTEGNVYNFSSIGPSGKQLHADELAEMWIGLTKYLVNNSELNPAYQVLFQKLEEKFKNGEFNAEPQEGN